jgi:hypothetical protein
VNYDHIKTVFISGPYRGDTPWDVECNIRRAEELSLEVWKLNEEGLRVVAVCTHANSRFFDKAIADEHLLEGYLKLLSVCDVLLTTPDWERSGGARDEIEFCKEHGIPVVYSIEKLREYLVNVEDPVQRLAKIVDKNEGLIETFLDRICDANDQKDDAEATVAVIGWLENMSRLIGKEQPKE